MSYRTEQEQIEIFTKWWKENGRITLIIIAAALALYVGWTQWQAHQQRRAEAASIIYQDFLQSMQNGINSDGVKTDLLDQLKKEYSETFYGQAAMLFLAQSAVTQGDLVAAEGHLDTLIKQRPNEDMAYTARLRSAKILHAMGKDDEALMRLREPVPAGFKALFAELRGDIYLGQNKLDQARSAYEEAKTAAGEEVKSRSEALEMKLSQANAAQ